MILASSTGHCKEVVLSEHALAFDVLKFDTKTIASLMSQSLDLVEPKPELSFEVPKSFLVVVPSSVKVYRAVFSSLENCPSASISLLVTVNLKESIYLINIMRSTTTTLYVLNHFNIAEAR